MRTISKICAALLPLFMMVSCSLDENNTSYATADTYYKSVDECRTGINGCYSPLKDMKNAVQTKRLDGISILNKPLSCV